MSLLYLPTESLDEVARYLSKKQLLVLCLVSKRLNPISTRFLYRRVILVRPAQIVLCCKTLMLNRVAAKAVRKFQVHSLSSICSSPFYHILMSTLQRLSNITELILRFGYSTPWCCLRALEQCNLPNLRVLELSSAPTDSILTFLQGVWSLRILRLRFFEFLDSRRPPIGPFPNLVEYDGCGTYLPDAVIGSPLRSVIFSIDRDTHIDSAIEALSLSTTHILNIDFVSDNWDPRVFQLLAVHVPEVTTLQCGNSAIGQHEEETFLAAIRPLLSAFKRLERLTICYPDVLHDIDYFLSRRLRDDHGFVQAVGKLCPLLTVCVTPPAIQWQKIHANVWIPVWNDSCTRAWVSITDSAEVRSRPWLEPLVEHLCEEHNLENPLKDSGSQESSVASESSDSDDYEQVSCSTEDDDWSTEGGQSDESDSGEDARPDAIAFLTDLWYNRSR